MATKSTLVRGFKKKAEDLALEYREKLDLKPWSPLNAFDLASHLGITVYSATDLLKDTNHLHAVTDNCGWSALTMKTKANNTIIIHNPFHSSARQQSNVMHEIAHIICKHEVSNSYNIPLPFGMRQYNINQEDEAICLGSALQIARPGLLWALKRNMTKEGIAFHFNASIEMVAYRLRLTGAEKQSYFSKIKNFT